ncbi:MAG: type II secretion system protein GspL [Gammaproteobacteria bacterium]
MRPQVDFSVPADQWNAECLLTDEHETTGKVKQGPISVLKGELADVEPVLIIPSEQVLITSVHLPGKNPARLRQALPYALEDQLISDIENQYFILGPKTREKTYAVAVVEKAYLDSILTALNEAGIYPGSVFPESLLLPFSESSLTLIEDNNRIIVRYGLYNGFACDRDNLELIIKSLLDDESQDVKKIIFYGATDVLSELERPVEYEQHDFPRTIISLLYHDSVKELNLLPRQFVHREKLDKKLKQWLPAAAMLVAWIVIQLSVQVYDYYQLKKQDRVLQASLEKIYRQAFPESKRIVNVEVQMRQKLKELREKSGRAQSGFTEMMVKSAPILKKAPGLKLQSLRYHDGRMDIDLEIRDLQSLEQLKENLIKAGNWEVEIQSASSAENKVQSRLQVRSSS